MEELFVLLWKAHMSGEPFENMKQVLHVFQEDHVILKRGLNRDPYAGELHEIAEDRYPYSSRLEINTCYSPTERVAIEFKAHSKEPLYEWQWISSENGKQIRIDEYMTREEGMEFSNTSLSPWYPDEKTKRVRQ